MNIMMLRNSLLCLLMSIALCVMASFQIFAQQQSQNSKRIVASFLQISPSARISAMGEAETAGEPSISDIANVSKLVFLNQQNAVSLGYRPWTNSGSGHIFIAQPTYFTRLNERYVLAAGLKYFSIGEVDLRDENQQALGVFKPGEFSAQISLAAKLGRDFSLGTTFKYIRSSIIPENNKMVTSSGAVAFDISGFYSRLTYFLDFPAKFSAGLIIADIGTKLNYGPASQAGFLPARIKVGIGSKVEIDDFNSFALAIDAGKLMVPTIGLSSDTPSPLSSLSDLVQSFSDRPASMEFNDVVWSFGTEYRYSNSFALRAGYHYEQPSSGNYRFFSFGTGLGYKSATIDLSYLFSGSRASAFTNSLNLSFGFSFGTVR